jgi:hypothetical protein
MKIVRRLALLTSLIVVTTLLVGAQNKSNIAADGEPETVITTFQVKDGKEAEMSKLIQRAWKTYNKLGMVLQQPNIIAHGTDDAGKLFFIEILSWKSQDTPDNAPAEVKAIWAEMEALCEKRDGHRGIEFHEVHIDSGASKYTRRKSTRG